MRYAGGMAFSLLEEDIIRTVAYGQSVGFPLTNIGIVERMPHGVPMGDVMVSLEYLVSVGALVRTNGRYGIGNDARACIEAYANRAALTRVKWLRALRTVRVLTWVPWVRAVWVSGSLAYDASDVDGDTDVVCLVAPGHIFSARLFALALSSLFGVRRAAHEAHAPDKLCMNHWIADDGRQLAHRSVYTAWVYAHMVPVYGMAAARAWRECQTWIQDYTRYRAEPSSLRALRPSSPIIFGKMLCERLLSFIEPFAKRVQLGRIQRGVAVVGRGRIQANNHALEFHPRSQEPLVLSTYTALCASVGVMAAAQDSGLGKGACDVLDMPAASA